MSRLHDVIVRNAPSDHVLGPTWEQIHGVGAPIPVGGPPWWQDRREQLIRIARAEGCAYVYDRATLEHHARQLLAIGGVERIFYAVKANPHPEVLRTFADLGLAFECVSQGECERVLETLPGIDRDTILFTPNFAPRSEYEWAIEQRRAPHARQPARAASLAGALPRPRRPGAGGHGIRTRPPRPRAHRGRALEVRRAAVRARRARAPGRRGRHARGRPACPHGQRRVRRTQLAAGRAAARRPRRAIPGRAGHGPGRRARRAREAGAGPGGPRDAAGRDRGPARALARARDLARARPVPGCAGRRAARAGDAAQGQGRGAIRGRGDRA